jgi:ABC-type Fe3+/spermidine/putrescine transport system ATPase subunit
VDGVAIAPDTVARGGLTLRVAAAGLALGARIAVSIRPHQIELVALPAAGLAGAGANALRGTVQRASFLGDSVDYQVQVTDSDVILRVAAPTSQRLRPGDSVGLRILPTACVPLADPVEGPAS